MVHRFQGLGHDPVIGRHHQHDDVGDLRTTRPHPRECLVAGSVNEGDPAVVGFHLIGANVLGNATSLLLADAGLPDHVQQRRLPMVHVAHDGNHRGARYLLAGFWLAFRLDRLQGLFLEADDASLGPKSRATSVATCASIVWLIVAKMPRLISRCIKSLALMSSFSVRSLTVMPSVMVISRVMGSGVNTGAERGGRRVAALLGPGQEWDSGWDADVRQHRAQHPHRRDAVASGASGAAHSDPEAPGAPARSEASRLDAPPHQQPTRSHPRAAARPASELREAADRSAALELAPGAAQDAPGVTPRVGAANHRGDSPGPARRDAACPSDPAPPTAGRVGQAFEPEARLRPEQ